MLNSQPKAPLNPNTPQQTPFPQTVSFPENKVGQYTQIGHSGYIGRNTIIGKYCSIAPHVYISPYTHPTKYLTTSSTFYKLHTPNGISPLNTPDDPFLFEEFKGCNIGNDVWIAVNAVILDGITIGDGAVIAANSTVTHDVPPYAIVAGSPARIIKYRFSQEIIERLLEIRWWDLPPEMLKNLPHRVESALITLEQRIKTKRKGN